MTQIKTIIDSLANQKLPKTQFLNSISDVAYIVDSENEYLGSILYLKTGGIINTYTQTVESYIKNKKLSQYLTSEPYIDTLNIDDHFRKKYTKRN